MAGSTAASGPLVAVLDYGAANMVSIGQALVTAGARVVVAEDAAALRGVDAVVVPGVGAAVPAMAHLTDRGLAEPLRDWVRAGRPCLGICLGYQILFERSAEFNSGSFSGRSSFCRDELCYCPDLSGAIRLCPRSGNMLGRLFYGGVQYARTTD